MAARLRLVLIAAGVSLSLAAGASGAAWFWAQDYLASPGPLPSRTVVVLPPGSGVTAIAGRLTAAGAIEHPWAFAVMARVTGRDRSLKAGEYMLEPGMSPDMVMALLETGKVVQHPVQVPEGLTVREVYALLANADVLGGELPELPAEGSLMPDTYLVPRGEPRARLVERMRSALDVALAEAWVKRQPDLPLRSPQEVLILASIIEKETALPEEYGLVAAVFANRLRQGMLLQTDPTVIYALAEGRGPLGRELTRADLQVEHPYNTYRVAGLPPGPIANAGRAAIAAAVAPAAVDYLYFVASGDGGHTFARTLAEHNRNVARWRKLRKSSG